MTNLEFKELAVQLCEAAKQAIENDFLQSAPQDFEELVFSTNIKHLEDLQQLGKNVVEAINGFNNSTETEDDLDTLYNMIEYLNEPSLYNIFKTEELLTEFKEKIEEKLE